MKFSKRSTRAQDTGVSGSFSHSLLLLYLSHSLFIALHSLSPLFILSLCCVSLVTYLDTMLNISGSKGAASAGSLCMNVPNITIHSPISSSLYSSLTIPHSEHRCVTHSSPILKELCLVSVPSGLGDISALNQVPGLLGS